MKTAEPPLQEVARAISYLDVLRSQFGNVAGERSPKPAALAAPGHKEWLHFSIRLPDGYLIVNVAWCERRSGRQRWAEGRVTALVGAPRFCGDSLSFEAARVRGRAGSLHVELGGNQVSWNGEHFFVHFDLGSIRGSARLRPVAYPVLSNSLDDSLCWVVVPHLRACGELSVGGRNSTFVDAPAYHDHNWGRFDWGSQLAWQWGYVLPDDPQEPHRIVFSRLMDTHARVARRQGAIVWRGSRYVRTFGGSELQMSTHGSLRARGAVTVPASARFVLPEIPCGVPAMLRLSAHGTGDALQLESTIAEHCRIAIPSEQSGFSTIVLNEAHARTRARGCVAGYSFDFEGGSVMEFVGEV